MTQASQKRPGNPKQPGFVTRMRARLNRGDSFLSYDLRRLVSDDLIDQDAIDDLETRLLLADVGVEATSEVIHHVQTLFDGARLRTQIDLANALRTYLGQVLAPCSEPLTIPAQETPFVILMVGVNGAGKTTTIGKLARRYKDQGLSVMLAAGDTFRAAAVEQLQGWGERNSVPVIAQSAGSDSASVVFDAFAAAKARGVDVLIADTAGRLHTQSHLMDELKKIKRVLAKHDETAPHETMLVLDATAGGNALQQAVHFHESIALTGLTLTKLDGSASGGIIFAIAKKLGLPIRYIGVGEQAEDLGEFEADQFMDVLFSREG